MADRAMAASGHQTEVLRIQGDPRWSSLLPGALRSVRRELPDLLLYVPYSGLTSKSLLRHLALRNASRAPLDVLVALQSDSVVRKLPTGLAPTLGAYASERLRSLHRGVTRDSCVLPPAVDSARFRPAEHSRWRIREEIGIPSGKPMALHVGHLRRSRGLEPLVKLAREQTVDVVMVASTATEPDLEVEAMLRAAGVVVRREFLPKIEWWYQAADVYVFPVSDLQGSIEVPLTVLEAMACGTPVASAPFGGLPSLFASTESLRFAPPGKLAATAEEMIGVDGLPNRVEVQGMNENAFVDALENVVERSGDR
jgi:glycosyltransferase involved in cell wall biosynthesis